MRRPTCSFSELKYIVFYDSDRFTQLLFDTYFEIIMKPIILLLKRKNIILENLWNVDTVIFFSNNNDNNHLIFFGTLISNWTV